MNKENTSTSQVKVAEVVWSWIGAFLGIGVLSFLQVNVITDTDLVMVIGSFGASAVLIYGAIHSPLAQPRNLIGGHVFSALIGVTSYQLFPTHIWLASAIAVATAIAVMQATKTVHPPGGATALIAVIGSAKIHNLGYVYAVLPVGLGAAILLIVAVIVNRVSKRKYPESWF
jgi:CBS-domain-containing membrane protein